MRTSSTWKRSAMAVTGLAFVAGALVVCKTTPGCYLWARPYQETSTSSKPLGEEKEMSVANAKSKIEHANDSNFRNLVLKAEVPVLVDFYADWCGPCQRLSPVLEELAAENPGAKVVKVNVDDNPSLAETYGVDSIPSLKVFKNGKVVDEVVGLASKTELREMLIR